MDRGGAGDGFHRLGSLPQRATPSALCQHLPAGTRHYAPQADAPLRHLCIHPLSSVLLIDSTRMLLSSLPLLERFELSLSQVQSASDSSRIAHRGDFVERCLDLHMSFGSHATVARTIQQNRDAFQLAVDVDPTRVFIVQAPVVASAGEREAQLRERSQRQAHNKRGKCSLM